jgi:hypothetical protein
VSDPLDELTTVHLDRAGAMNEETVRFYVAEIAMAVDYLHSKKIVHRWAGRLAMLTSGISNPIISYSMNGVTHILPISTSLCIFRIGGC